MKKEICISLFFSVFAVAFYAVTNFWDTIATFIPIDKEFILIILLILVQTQLLTSLKSSFLDTNPLLIQAKRKLWLFYTETAEDFPLIYQKASKRHTFKAAGFLLAHLGICHIDDKNYASAKKWLQKEERIPYNQLPNSITFRDKCRIHSVIISYQATNAQYEDIFYDCLAHTLLGKEKKQSIIELILIWLSYFYFLTEVFHINLSEHLSAIITFSVITIADMAKHYITYKKEVEQAASIINSFHDQMRQMCKLMLDKDCQFVDIEGECIPYSITLESSETDRKEMTL